VCFFILSQKQVVTGAFDVILRANSEVCNGNSQLPMTQETLLVKITEEDSAYHFL
jgi:hypothetical protein